MKVSLGVVLMVIIVVVAIISGVLALVPLLEASKSSSFDIAGDFSETISDRISVRVNSVFDDIQTAVDIIQRAVNGSAIMPNSAASVINWMGPTITAYTHAQSCFYCLDDGTTVRLLASFNGATTLSIQVFNATTNTSSTGTFNVTSANIAMNATVAGKSLAPLNCSEQPHYALIRAARSWTPLFFGSDLSDEWPHLIAGAPVLDPSTASYNSIGAFGFEFSAQYLEDYLHTLDIASTGVAAIVNVKYNTSVVALRLQEFNEVPGSVIGSNGKRRPWAPTEVPSPSLNRALDATGASFYTCATPCRLHVGDGYLSTLFVRVTAPYNAYNLDLRLILAIPSSDFLAGIQSSIVIGSLSAAGGIVLLAALSALLLFSFLKPLHHLEQRLYAIEVLKDEDGTGSAPKSFLREIYNIEVAYATMRSELRKMKSFLPQSVLRQLEEELAEEEAMDEGRRSSDDSNDNGITPGTSGEAASPPGFIGEQAMVHHHNVLPGSSAVPNGDSASNGQGNSSTPQPHSLQEEDLPNRSAVNPLLIGQRQDQRNNGHSPNAAAGCAAGAEQSIQLTAVAASAALTATIDSGLPVVNPLRVLNTVNRDDDNDGRNSPGNESMAPGASMRTEFVALTITEQRKRRANRPTLQSLNDLCVLSAKRITVVMANVIGFHQVLELQGASGIETFHATLLDIVLHEVNASGGVLDFVHGDRFLITYNASTTCIPHSICAAEMITRVVARLDASPELMSLGYQGIRIGVSAGEALCGNFGNDIMKRFSAVGPVVHQAFTLMQQTKAEEGGHGQVLNLICGAVFARIKTRFIVEHVNYVQLPGQTNAGLISTIRAPRPGVEPFEALLARTRIGTRRRTPLQPVVIRPTEGGADPSAELIAPHGMDVIPCDEIERINQINVAFDTFANGDIDAAKELASTIPLDRARALQKAFQVCE